MTAEEIAEDAINGNLSHAEEEIQTSDNPAGTAVEVLDALVTKFGHSHSSAIMMMRSLVR